MLSFIAAKIGIEIAKEGLHSKITDYIGTFVS